MGGEGTVQKSDQNIILADCDPYLRRYVPGSKNVPFAGLYINNDLH